MITAYFDGAVEPHNPGGYGGYGLIVYEYGRVVFSEAVYVGCWPSLSNNCTEYAGVIAAFRYLLREGVSDATVYGDADMIVKQLNGQWRAKGGAYLPYYREAYTLRLKLPKVELAWIPREMNGAADDLSKQAVTRKPRMIGFSLDHAMELAPMPSFPPKRKRKRDMRERPLTCEVSEDEAWDTFMQRYGTL